MPKTFPTVKKTEPIPFDVAELVARHGDRLSAWCKPVPFDHAHVSAKAVCLLLNTDDGIRATHIQCYNDALSPKQAAHLDALQDGRLVADPTAFIAGLMQRGYTTSTAPARQGRKRKEAK
jgi:hypothetical protein